MNCKKLILAALFLLSPLLIQAQILDDSTKQVYGPTTTRYLLEQDLLEDREQYHTIDTTLDNFHNYTFISRNGYRLVDLGNLGSATRPVFYSPPAQIGVYSGFNAYNPYFYYPADVRYYDTKSPYSSLYYVQGGLLQQLLKVDFSRNITPRWNAGFGYMRTTAPKQFAYPNNREDRQIDGHSFVFFTRYQSKDSTYHLLAHLSHLNHTSYDLGGLLPEANGDYRKGFDTLLIDFQNNGDAQINNTARSIDLRLNYHLYHQYKFAPGFQVYHILDRQMQRYSYLDTNPRDPSIANSLGRLFYPHYYFSDSTTDERTRFEVIENKIGLKGSLSGWDYRLYGRHRFWKSDYQVHLPNSEKTAENEARIDSLKRRQNEVFLGLWTQYRFSEKFRLQAEGELMLIRDFRLKGFIETPWFVGGYQSMSYSPSLIQQQAIGNHALWNNFVKNSDGFKNTFVNQIFGTFILKTGGLSLMPSVTITNLNNYIYFDEQVQPRQIATAIQLIYAGVNLDFKWKILRTQNEAVYTLRSGPDVIRIPEFFVTSRLFAEGPLFKKALYMQLGGELHYKSNYYGDAYMPAIGQFYLQNEFPIQAYSVVEAFANARINRVRLFFKFSNLLEGLYKPGYFISPYFPGQRRTFAFGVNWLLFD